MSTAKIDLTDVAKTLRANDTAEAYSSDVLLQAVSACIAEVLQATSVLQALPNTLEEIAKIVNIDRMIMVEMVPDFRGKLGPSVAFVWNSERAPQVDTANIIETSPGRDEVDEWLSPLPRGEVVTGFRPQTTGHVHELLVRLQVMSMLQAPIMIKGEYWGQIVFEDCSSEHQWSSAQLNILKLFADLLGVAMTRERSNEALRRREAILQAVTTCTVELTTASNLQDAITSSLQTVAQAVGVDRMFVVEVTPAQHDSPPEMLLRYHWHAPNVISGVAILKQSWDTQPPPELVAWIAPLHHGKPVVGHRSQASRTLKAHMERMQVLSILIVPITVDGKHWGQVSFDDCTRERDWNQTEIDILRTLADLIGSIIMRERYTEALAKANTIVQNSTTILYRLRGEPSFPMVYVSQNIALLGHSADEFLDSPTLYHSFVHPEDRGRMQASMVDLLRADATPASVEFRMLSAAGNSHWMENRYTPVRDADGRLLEVEGIMIDITERKKAEEHIALLARTDVLTGLANRVTFNDRLRQAFAAAKRGANPFVVLYLDLDHFKEVNDTRGHPVGDELLQKVSERLKRVTRVSDVVARLGGDEFAILQLDIADPTSGGALATKIIEALSAPYAINGELAHIGTSVGIAVFNEDTASPDDLLVQADQALYHAKEKGRGQYCFHSRDLNDQAHERVALANDLRNALVQDQLELHYQPQVELSSGRIVGMEALIRWQHPKRGLLLPEVFLPIAEKSGVTEALGCWVLDGACKQLAQWRADGLNVPVIAINVGLAQIKNGRKFVRDVQNSLARWNLKPSDLELDVTEFVLARTALAQSRVLEELQQLGVCIAIDNFGAQYSSLDYLRTYQVGRLKIARSMVSSANEGRSSSMIRAIVSLAGELGVDVVAEGVENEQQRQTLVNICSTTKGLGFYFSTPIRPEDTTKMLRTGSVGPREKKD
jgi:diguanylate cyclase (GGDEF)-like protein/PAS domain S-box-containing protein